MDHSGHFLSHLCLSVSLFVSERWQIISWMHPYLETWSFGWEISIELTQVKWDKLLCPLNFWPLFTQLVSFWKPLFLKILTKFRMAAPLSGQVAILVRNLNLNELLTCKIWKITKWTICELTFYELLIAIYIAMPSSFIWIQFCSIWTKIGW